MPGNQWSCGPAYRKVSGSYSQAGTAGLVADIFPVQDLSATIGGGSNVGFVGKHWMKSFLSNVKTDTHPLVP